VGKTRINVRHAAVFLFRREASKYEQERGKTSRDLITASTLAACDRKKNRNRTGERMSGELAADYWTNYH